VFTVSNGPVYHGKNLHSVLHYLIVDAMLNVMTNGSMNPWLNDTTRCTYPEPWISALSTNVPDRPLPAAEPPPTGKTRTDGWLNEAYTLYVGNYYHRLLGFFNVTYSPLYREMALTSEDDDEERSQEDGASRQGQLRFRSGSVGEGHLDYVDGVTWMMVFDGPLAYFGRTGPYRHYPLPIVFHGVETEAKLGDQFTGVAVIPYEPRSPPTYRRLGLSNTASRTPSKTAAALLTTLVSAGLMLVGQLTASCAEY